MKTKKCTKCGIEKPLDAEHYHRKSLSPSGFQSSCKVCKLQYQAEHRSRPEFKERQAEYRAEYNSRPEVKKRKAEYNAERNSRPEVKKRKAEYDAERNSRPENKEINRLRTAKWIKEAKSNQPACVYQIVNTANNKIYIGQTIRGELRWKQHLSDLRGNYHSNPKLQADFNKFGEEVFKWSIIKEYPKNKDTLLLEEARTIVKYRKEGKDLYNITLTIDQVQLLEENK